MNDCHNCMYRDLRSDSEFCVNCEHDNNVYTGWTSRDFSVTASNKTAVKEGVKYDQDKPQWTLVPFKALDEVVSVLTIGAKKYAPDNWKKVPNARQRYIDAAFRHMSAYAAGEKLDSETGKNHLAHAACCLFFLLAFDLDSSLEKDNG
jgi:hypothetical protein